MRHVVRVAEIGPQEDDGQGQEREHGRGAHGVLAKHLEHVGEQGRAGAEQDEPNEVEPTDARLTAKAWKELARINEWVNDTVEPITDLEHWGVVDRWDYPDDGQGDCEDYVLLKRRMLMQAGWPRQALLITVVRDKRGDGHAVLTVKTDRGELILDNQNRKILLWSDTGYRFVKRQSQSDPNVWVALEEPRPASATATSR